MIPAIFAAVLLCAQAQNAPSALQRLAEARQALRTGEIDWSWWNAQLNEGQKKFYSARFAPGAVALEQRGPFPGTQPDNVHRTLQRDGRQWHNPGGGRDVDLLVLEGPRRGLPNIRSLGLSFGFVPQGVTEALFRDPVAQPGPREYRERREGDLHVVSAKTDLGEITWWIDSERGWNPVRVRLESGGEVLQEARVGLKQWGDTWFPESVAFFRSTFRNGEAPCEVVRIEKAVFNAPDQPKDLQPSDIGVEIGTNVLVRDKNLKVTQALRWDGQDLITLDEFMRRETRGDIQVSPVLQQAWALETERVRIASKSESEWRRYTRRFIERYELNRPQSERAWAILRDCEERAEQYARAHRAEFEKAQSDLAAYKTAAEPDRTRWAEIERRIEALMQPIDRIFERELKPRLDKLPTLRQRQRAGDK